MPSFKVTTNQTIKVVPTKFKGRINYFFKGKPMHHSEAVVINSTATCLSVERCDDKQIFNFYKEKDQWLLEKHDKPNSLLCGTNFTYTRQCNEE